MLSFRQRYDSNNGIRGHEGVRIIQYKFFSLCFIEKFHYIKLMTFYCFFFSRIFWDLEANKRLQEFDAHNGDVCTLSLSPDNNTYVTGSVDRTCKLWDVRDPSCKQVFFGHEGDVNCVCVSFKTNSFHETSKCEINKLSRVPLPVFHLKELISCNKTFSMTTTFIINCYFYRGGPSHYSTVFSFSEIELRISHSGISWKL